MRVHFQKLPTWLRFNVFYRAKLVNSSGAEKTEPQEHVEVHPFDANLISSKKLDGKHVLMLDLDVQHAYLMSSTSGHGHLIIDAELETDQLKEIVDVLAKYGILQKGIKKQLDDRGFLTLRMPGMKKGDVLDDASLKEYSEKLVEQTNKQEQYNPAADVNIKWEISTPHFSKDVVDALFPQDDLNTNATEKVNLGQLEYNWDHMKDQPKEK